MIMGISLPMKCWLPNFHSIYTQNHRVFIAHEIYGGSDFQIHANHGIFIPHENNPLILPLFYHDKISGFS